MSFLAILQKTIFPDRSVCFVCSFSHQNVTLVLYLLFSCERHGPSAGPKKVLNHFPFFSAIDSLTLVAGVTLPRGVGLGHVRAAYDHTERGENQMTFVEGDLITTIGTSSDGWQYGQNTRTRQ